MYRKREMPPLTRFMCVTHCWWLGSWWFPAQQARSPKQTCMPLFPFHACSLHYLEIRIDRSPIMSHAWCAGCLLVPMTAPREAGIQTKLERDRASRQGEREGSIHEEWTEYTRGRAPYLRHEADGVAWARGRGPPECVYGGFLAAGCLLPPRCLFSFSLTLTRASETANSIFLPKLGWTAQDKWVMLVRADRS
jgi:hypothetical protein